MQFLNEISALESLRKYSQLFIAEESLSWKNFSHLELTVVYIEMTISFNNLPFIEDALLYFLSLNAGRKSPTHLIIAVKSVSKT